MKKIAVIGTGISGLTAGRLLHRDHEITVFEAADYIGGHTNTISLGADHGNLHIDTGFIVFNDWTYPNFIKLLNQLGVRSQPSSMSFSVTCARTRLEYNGSTINSLFAQRRNFLRPAFYRMIADILRFNREASTFLLGDDHDMTLGEFLRAHDFGGLFESHFILPMGAAIWSSGLREMRDFPARYFMEFFNNHGMLSVNNRPQWRVIEGGSQSYIAPITSGWRERIRLNAPVTSVRRTESGVRLSVGGSTAEEDFDEVIFACHSDQVLRILKDADASEREILGACRYSSNRAVLHTDQKMLPGSRRAWAAWNYLLPRDQGQIDKATVTYNMNILQGLSTTQTHSKVYCVTLNPAPGNIDPRKVLREFEYHHPVYSREAIAAQKRRSEINGKRHTFFCGAYWGYGFHEDGVKSALAVTTRFFGRGLDA